MKNRRALPFTILLLALAVSSLAPAQGKPAAPADERARLIAAAREIMAAQTYCALVTIDETGRPQIRTMNPFPPEEDMTVWVATNTRSRKVREIRRDPRVALYYSNHANAIGYVQITGHAVLVDDKQEILKRKRAYWDQAFPGLQNLVLIKVVPERLDVLNYKADALDRARPGAGRPEAVASASRGGPRPARGRREAQAGRSPATPEGWTPAPRTEA
jgi:general stress protein 26